MKKLVLALLVGALLVPATVCTVNAQENNRNTSFRFQTTGQPLTEEQKEKAIKEYYAKREPAIELRNAWREKDLELANTIGKIRFKQDYQEVICSIVMALEKGGLGTYSITEPGIITINSVRPRNILNILKMQKIDLDKIKEMNDKLEKIEEKFNSEVEKSGIDMEFMQKDLPGYHLYSNEAMKIIICVFQKTVRYPDRTLYPYTAVNIYLKVADDSFNVKNWVALYPDMAEECYKRLIELFVQEGLTVLKE